MTFQSTSKMKTSFEPQSVLGGVKRALMVAASTSAFCLLGASLAVGGSLPHTTDCTTIKQVVKTAGKDLYRYRDPQHPALQLYTLYVRSDLQCNVGEALEEKAVPSLDGCFVQTCVDQDDYGNH